MVDITAGGPNKYDRFRRQGRKLIELVCIKDGSVMQFWDEGPHPVTPDGRPVTKWQERSATPSRAKLIAAVLKKDDQGLPIFYAREKGQKVWEVEVGRYIDIPAITDDVLSAQARYIQVRDDNIARSRAEYEAKQKAADAATTNTVESALMAALARIAAPKVEEPVRAPAKPVAKQMGGAL